MTKPAATAQEILATDAAPSKTRKRAPSALAPSALATSAPKATPKAATHAEVSKQAVAKKAPPAAETIVVEAPQEAKHAKQKKAKLIRDSFTMPEPEYQLLAAIKKRCLDAGVAAKKSEILRAAIKSLAGLGDADLARAIQGLEAIKTGRPTKSGK